MSEQGSSVASFLRGKFGSFYTTHGLEIDEVGPGEVVLRLPRATDEQRGGGGTDALNGGVMAYMFDGALGAAVASAALHRVDAEALALDRFGQVTINLNISYLRAGLGDAFEARARVLQLGGSVAFAEGKLYDERGQLCASATGVWRVYLPGKPER